MIPAVSKSFDSNVPVLEESIRSSPEAAMPPLTSSVMARARFSRKRALIGTAEYCPTPLDTGPFWLRRNLRFSYSADKLN